MQDLVCFSFDVAVVVVVAAVIVGLLAVKVI